MNNNKKLKKILINLPNNIPIYIAGHINPDQDSIGSCLAIARFLMLHKKQVFVLLKQSDSDVISWQEKNDFIVSNIKYNDYNFIMMDSNKKSRLGDFEQFFDKAKYKINIDHHQNNEFQADYTLSLTDMSSTCEIVYEIVKSKNLDKKSIENLYAGIMTDTNCFTRRLSNKTLCIAQSLINSGINYEIINKKTFSGRSLYELKALAKLVDEIKTCDNFHYVVVDKEKKEFASLSHNSIVKKIAEDLRKAEEIDTFILMIKNKNKIIAKTMTNKGAFANKIAEQFGGGGHKKEAGFTVTDMDTKEIIIKISEYLKTLQKDL